MSTVLFWAITQPAVIITYRRFGTACRSNLEDGTDRMYRNVGKELPLLAAK